MKIMDGFGSGVTTSPTVNVTLSEEQVVSVRRAARNLAKQGLIDDMGRDWHMGGGTGHRSRRGANTAIG